AANRVDADYRGRVIGAAAGDTVTGANVALEQQQFRLDVARHGTALTVAPEFEIERRQILTAAARVYYGRGVAEMTGKRPKHAFDLFTTATTYDPNYKDLAT